MTISLTGIRATGDIHIGNYLGAIKPALDAQASRDCLYFIADLHALTDVSDPAFLRTKTYEVVAHWLALGFDTTRHIIFRQSDVPLVTELAWYLSAVTGVGLLEKGHAYKDALAKSKEVSFSLLAYPVLMAADILIYDADEVPVGKDQKQHVEMARDMAGSLNAAFGEGLLTLPRPVISEDVMTIPGLDGRKMSKSYNNTIPVFAESAELKKKVLSLKTDSTPLEEPKQLKGTTLGDLFKLFAAPERYADLEKRLAAGGLGWGHAKVELFEALEERFGPHRGTYHELCRDTAKLDAVLEDGARRACERANKVLNRVRQAIGFRPWPYAFKVTPS